MPDENVYHADGGRFVAPGDPIMDRKGDMATFIGLTRRKASEPLVAVHWTDRPECVSECRPSLFNLHVG